ncbi:MAG: hypothetical protein ACRDNI_07650 [Gaiellaceae bacterium]
MGQPRGWRWFAAWICAGGLLFFAFLTGFSIGLFLFPFAVVGCVLLARATGLGPPMLGVVSGTGLVCLGIALANRSYDPCPPQGQLTIPPGETSATCGGLDPLPWLVAGVLLLAVGVAGHALADRSRRSI